MRLAVLLAALWWGSLTAVGFVVVPLLFRHLPTATAGQVAAALFSAQAGVSVACAALLLMVARGREQAASPGWGRGVLGFVLAGAILALLVEYGVSPRIAARQDLGLWHPVGSAMYVLQWVCALVTLWKLGARGMDPGSSPG